LREPAFRSEFGNCRFSFGFPWLGPVFWVVRQADQFDPKLNPGRECNGALAARAGEGAWSRTEFPGHNHYYGNETEDF